MMHHGNCKCFHHICAKILVGLAWVAAVLFFWAGWKAALVWNVSAEGYFRVVIVLILLAFSTKFCGYCGWGKMGGKMMNCACACDECAGGKCGGMHSEGHRH